MVPGGTERWPKPFTQTTKKHKMATTAARARAIRLSWGRRLVHHYSVAQRTNALTNDVVGRTWVLGREFESHRRP